VALKSSRQIFFLQSHRVEKKGRKMQFSIVIFIFTLATVSTELDLDQVTHKLELHKVEPKLELELHEVFVPKLKEPPLVILRKLYKDPTDFYQENERFS
jgi:hypothetical protein